MLSKRTFRSPPPMREAPKPACKPMPRWEVLLETKPTCKPKRKLTWIEEGRASTLAHKIGGLISMLVLMPEPNGVKTDWIAHRTHLR